MSRRSTRARRSSSRVQEQKVEELDEELKEIFDDDSEEEALGDDSDEDPDFEFRDEVQADEDEEFAAPEDEEDEEYEEAAATRKRKRDAAMEAMSKRQRTGDNWNNYATPGHMAAAAAGHPPGAAAPNPYLQMIQSKYGFQGAAAATASAPGGARDPQQQLMELRQQQLAQQQAIAHQQRLRLLQQQQQQHAAALHHWQNRATQPSFVGQAAPPQAPTGLTLPAPAAAAPAGAPMPNVASLASAANAASNAATAFLARSQSVPPPAGQPVGASFGSLGQGLGGSAHAAALQAQQQQPVPETAVGLPPPPLQTEEDNGARLQQHLQMAQQQQLAQQQRLAQQQQLARQQQLLQQQQHLQQQAQAQAQAHAQPQAQEQTQAQGQPQAQAHFQAPTQQLPPVQSPAPAQGQQGQDKLTMSQDDLQRVRQLLLEYKMAQQNPDENVRRQALHEARLKMRQYPQLVAVLRAAAQKTGSTPGEAPAQEAPGPQLQANRAWQQQMHEQALRQQYAERARALQVAKAQQLSMNDGEPVNLSIPFNSFNKSASTEEMADENEDVSETDQEIQKIMKQCEALAKRLAKLAKSQVEDQELLDAKKEIDEEAKKDAEAAAAKAEGDSSAAQANGSSEEISQPESAPKDESGDTVMGENSGASAPAEETVSAAPVAAEVQKSDGDEEMKDSEAEKEDDKKEEKEDDDKKVEDDDKKVKDDDKKVEDDDKKDDDKKEEKKEGDGDDDDIKGPAIIRRQPASLQLKLTHYQLVGLNWLNLLHSEKLNGVLADEMGLGKTVQTIALLALLKERDNPQQPHLVVCPTTTLSNWVRELEVWCPTLAVMPYYGEMKEREQLRKVIADNHFDVIVTNYSAATGSARDRQFIKNMKFGYLVLDEAQYIKNKDSKRNKVLSKIKSENRLLLTGTPLQNNLEELWSLLQFIMPTFFKTAYEFDLISEDEELTKRRINRMKTIIAPFFLRRLKTSPEVSQGIPEKKIVVEECEMTESQQKSYDNYISQSRKLWLKYKDMGDSKSEETDLDKAEAARAQATPTDAQSPPPSALANGGGDTSSPSVAVPASTVAESTAAAVTSSDGDVTMGEAEAGEEENKGEEESKGEAEKEKGDSHAAAAAEAEEVDEDMGADDEEEPEGEEAAVAAAVEEAALEEEAEFVQMPASSQQVNNIFMQLRKVANHPLLARTRFKHAEMTEIIEKISYTPAYDGLSHAKIREDLERRSDFELSNMCSEIAGLEHYRLTQEMIQDNGKCRRLAELLLDLKAKGHRVLLFSQMTRVLDILEVLISQWGYQYLRLDGSTPVVVRQGLIDRFTVDESLFLFLLSTGAGGVGINLTAADVVIFYDISFNPQVDRQAQDRVHRVGQKKPVTIYKLVCKATVDEHMLRMADRKAKLNDDVLEEGTARKEEKKSKVWMLRSLLSEVFEDEEPEAGGRRRRRKGGAAKAAPAKRRNDRDKKKEAPKAAEPPKVEEVPADTPAS